MKKPVSLIVLLLLATAALAQDALDAAAQPELRRYTVEMIIFSYQQNVAAGSEIFMPDAPPPEALAIDDTLIDEFLVEELPEAIADLEPDGAADLQDLDPEEIHYAPVMLAEEDFTLLEILEKLEDLDAYETLVHFGWTQAMFPDQEVDARPLSSFVTPPPGLEGNLTLTLSRYLHLAINLQLDAATAHETTADAIAESMPVTTFMGDDDRFVESPVDRYPTYYRIEEDRIFRNGDLRYYDHPKFGVLAKITRVEEEEEEEEEEPAEDEFLGETELLGYDGE